MNHQLIRYDLHRNPPYQINYRSKRAGKHITATKRRITFQFGFSSAKAIASGESDVNCRGEEHEVVLIWSHVSGKRELFMDGILIHMSKGARGNTKFQHTWGIGPHVLKIVANFKDQAKNAERQFDLQLDGITFFRFFKIYQLGNSQVKDCGRVAYKVEDDSSTLQTTKVPLEVNVMPVDLFDTPSVTTISLVSSGSTLGNSDEFCPKSHDSVSTTVKSVYNVTQVGSQQSQFHDKNYCTLVPVTNQVFGNYGSRHIVYPRS